MLFIHQLLFFIHYMNTNQCNVAHDFKVYATLVHEYRQIECQGYCSRIKNRFSLFELLLICKIARKRGINRADFASG